LVTSGGVGAGDCVGGGAGGGLVVVPGVVVGVLVGR
jgi:hypothetical protein